MHKRLQILIVVTLGFILQLQAKEKVDSIFLQLDSVQNDSIKIEMLLRASQRLLVDNQDLPRCREILLQALEIAQKDSSDRALSKVHNKLGALYRNMADYDQALNHHHLSLLFAEKTNDSYLLSSAYNSIGVVYRRLDNHPQATKYHILGLKAAEAVNDLFSISVSLNSLGNIYSLNGQYPEALSYFTRGLKISQEMNNPRGEAMNYNNIGEVYEFMQQYDSAMVYYTHSLRLNRSIKNRRGTSISYNAIGKIHLFRGKPDVALDLFTQALKIDNELGDKKFIVDTYVNLARAYTEMGLLRDAERCVTNAIALADTISSVIHLQWAYETLSRVYEKQNDPTKALEYYKLSTVFKDSVINEKNSRAISMLDVMYDMEKKEQEIQILKQQRDLNKKELARQLALRNFYLTALALSIAIVLFTIYAFSVKRRSEQLIKSQKDIIENNTIQLNILQGEISAQNNLINKSKREIEELKELLALPQNQPDSTLVNDIQNTLTPPCEEFLAHFTDSFCLTSHPHSNLTPLVWSAQHHQNLYVVTGTIQNQGFESILPDLYGSRLLKEAVELNGITDLKLIENHIRHSLKDRIPSTDWHTLTLSVICIEKDNLLISLGGDPTPIAIVRDNQVVNLHLVTPEANPTASPQKVQSKDWVYIFNSIKPDENLNTAGKLNEQILSTLVENNNLKGEEQKKSLADFLNPKLNNNHPHAFVLVLGFKV